MDIKSRLQNKLFVTSLIAFIVLLIKTFTKIELPENLDVLVNMGLSLLSMLGIIIDPTTPGIKDEQ